MERVECKKVENCFGGTHIYEYRFNRRMSEDLIRNFAAFGLLTFHKNFPRPFFKVILSDGTVIKGVLNDTVIKVQFPDEDPQSKKQQFEKLVEQIFTDE